jgi:hypothetical protein
VLSGVTASLLDKGTFVMMEAESNSGVPKTQSVCVGPDMYINNVHSVSDFSVEKNTIDSIKNTLQGSVGGPIAVENAVTDTTVTIHVLVKNISHEPAFGWEGREILRHLEIQHEVALFVRSSRRLSLKSVICADHRTTN